MRSLCLASMFAMLSLSGASAAGLPPAAQPFSRMDLPWWRDRFAAKQAELHRVRPDLLLLGDSITANLEKTGPEPWEDFSAVWRHFYEGGRRVVNLGFKGDATAHLLWRIEHGETDGVAPRAAAVLIGANNFGHLHWPAAPTFSGIERIVSELHARLPGARIILLGVLPSIRSRWVDDNTAAVNAMLARRYGDGREAKFFDLTATFMKNGRVDPDAFYDGHIGDPPLHPTPAMQARIAVAIEPAVAAALGDTPRPPLPLSAGARNE